MGKKNVKKLILASVAVLALSGLATSPAIVAASHASEDHEHGHEHKEGEKEHEGHEEHEEGVVHLDEAQIGAAGIKTAEAGPGSLAREVNVPGRIVAAADRMAKIVPKVSGVVTEARKNLGDTVEKGEVLAVIESREMAEAVADYLAAKRAEELARTVFERERGLWNKKITAEQDYLNARNAHHEAKIRLDLTRQKLQALGQDKDTLKAYESGQGMEKLRFHEVRALLSGKVIDRELTLGEAVDSSHAVFTVADLSVVSVETAIAPSDLAFVKEGQKAVIAGSGGKAEGRLTFISPVINTETRAAKAIVALDNKEGIWRVGDIVNAALLTETQQAAIVVPRESLQTIEGRDVVFVRTDEGFEKRVVSLGRQDSRNAEIISGIEAGARIAVSGTFTLKAELGKAEAGHDHDH